MVAIDFGLDDPPSPQGGSLPAMMRANELLLQSAAQHDSCLLGHRPLSIRRSADSSSASPSSPITQGSIPDFDGARWWLGRGIAIQP